LKLGRFGAFVGCSNYPECKFTRQIGPNDKNAAVEPRELGPHPVTGKMIALKTGRFGPYVEVGGDEGEKPQRSGIPKGFSADAIDLEMAVKLLSLPREVGIHPESGKPILAGFGRFGPFVSHDGSYASLEMPEDVFTVGLNRAVTLIAERKEKGGRPRGAQALKELGKAPDSDAIIRVLKGRYGPYVSDGKINATLPNDIDPMSVELPQALELLAARAAKGPVKKKRKAVKKKAKSATGSATKKPAKSKAAAKSKTSGAKPANKTAKTKKVAPTGK
jgi:DNA topoisomerase-1